MKKHCLHSNIKWKKKPNLLIQEKDERYRKTIKWHAENYLRKPKYTWDRYYFYEFRKHFRKKDFGTYRLWRNLADKMNLQKIDKNIVLSNLSIYYRWKKHETLTDNRHQFSTELKIELHSKLKQDTTLKLWNYLEEQNSRALNRFIANKIFRQLLEI